MNRTEVNRAIARLRTLSQNRAAVEVQAYAAKLLTFPADIGEPTDLVAHRLVSVGLYCAAVARTTENSGTFALKRIIDRRYNELLGGMPVENELLGGMPVEEVFRASVSYPEEVARLLSLLSQTPRELTITGLAFVSEALVALR